MTREKAIQILEEGIIIYFDENKLANTSPGWTEARDLAIAALRQPAQPPKTKDDTVREKS